MIKNVILDTDLGSDVDDVGAVALANILHNKKIINLLCVTHTTSGLYGPLVCEAINEFYHNEDIPVGVHKGKEFLKEELPDNYPQPTSEAFPHKHQSVEQLPDAVKMLREYLEKNDHVTLIFVGPLMNLGNLMKSEPDEISPLNGEELINQKVDAVYIMGGGFPDVTGLPKFDWPEYNLAMALEETIYSVNRLKVKTVFVDGTIGQQVLTGAKVSKEYGDSHIVGYAYSHYIYKNEDNSRFSWDPMTVYVACIKDNLFKEVGPGIVNIDEKGYTTFKEDKNGNFYVIDKNKSYQEIQDVLEDLLMEGK